MLDRPTEPERSGRLRDLVMVFGLVAVGILTTAGAVWAVFSGRRGRSLKKHPHASISRQSWFAPPVTLPRWKELPLYRAPTHRSKMMVGWGSRLGLLRPMRRSRPFSVGN